MIKSKNIAPVFGPVEPTHEDRLLAAQLSSTSARGDFLIAALDLEETANDLDILAVDVEKEIDRLTGILQAAIEDADKDRKVAARLRSFVEADTNVLTLF